MHFSIATVALIASLAGNLAIAAPVSDDAPALVPRADKRPNYSVEVFTDKFCDDSTGVYGDNVEKCVNLDEYSVDIMSLTAEVKDSILETRCSWSVVAYPSLDCEDPSPDGWSLVREGQCHKHYDLAKKPIKSFGVWKFGPCD